MPDHEVKHRDYPTVDFVLGAIADWINKYRYLSALHHEFRHCSPDDVRQIAHDLSVPLEQLRALASKGPEAAALLNKLLVALHVEPDALQKSEPAIVRDMQRLCISCKEKKRCQRELTEGTAAEHYHSYCPNAFTLESIFAEKANSQSSCH